jgi:transposase
VPDDIVDRVVRLPGYGVYRAVFDEETFAATLWVRQRVSEPFFTCNGCGVGVREVHDSRERRVRDLPWGAWKIWLVIEIHRVRCRRCGVKVERLDFLEGKHPYTRRFSQAVARDCEDMAVSRAASKWGLSTQTTRRMDKRALVAWSARRKRRPLRQMGVDELFWRKGKCLTVVSDLELGEPIWAGPERKRETMDRFFAERLPPRWRRAVRAVCVDMCAPFLASIREHLPNAAIVFDKCHVMRQVNNAVDETRRQEFFRRRGPFRAIMRGKRWLLLTRWRNLSPSKQTELCEALALNRRLFKAYYLKEQIERLWSYLYEGAALRFFTQWLSGLRWQRLPAFKKLARTLCTYLDGVLAYCRHKVPFGVVEAINGNLRALTRRGRGYRDHQYLILKAQKSSAQARFATAA